MSGIPVSSEDDDAKLLGEMLRCNRRLKAEADAAHEMNAALLKQVQELEAKVQELEAKDKAPRFHPYQRPSGGGGAAAAWARFDISKVFCKCEEGRQAEWFCHNLEQAMCHDCKIHHEQFDIGRSHHISKISGRPRAGEGSRP